MEGHRGTKEGNFVKEGRKEGIKEGRRILRMILRKDGTNLDPDPTGDPRDSIEKGMVKS